MPRLALLFVLILPLHACTGAMLTHAMPGQSIVVEGSSFTVQVEGVDATVQNFETGRTPPPVLERRARLAAQQVSGCRTSTIVKDGITNTWYITLACAT